MIIGDGFWLQSPLFKPEPEEDAHTNPGCFGKALAEWIEASLGNQGIQVEGVIPEDWGWCVMVSRGPYLIWIGCGNVQDDSPPQELTWHCFVEAEIPFWKFWNRWIHGSEMRAAGARIRSMLAAAFAAEPAIRMVEER